MLALSSALTGGCAASPSPQIERWTKDRGGVLAGAPQQRADRALARLRASGALNQSLTVSVLNTRSVAAFCWRSGAVFVTRGLLDLLDDDELAAAIAHESGHLLLDGHLPAAAALDGCRRMPGSRVGEEAEMAADLMGRELLRLAGVSEDALPRLLGKLARDPAATAACRNHLSRRIARLNAAAQARH
ncbi:MAG: M48 family metalloprotease [Planctomycetota bacterium]|nr:M48 family metalloprotease [Planctomycetota bacterium]